MSRRIEVNKKHGHCTNSHISQVVEYHGKLKKTHQILTLHQRFG